MLLDDGVVCFYVFRVINVATLRARISYSMRRSACWKLEASSDDACERGARRVSDALAESDIDVCGQGGPRVHEGALLAHAWRASEEACI